jgi:CHAT domain-containing protein
VRYDVWRRSRTPADIERAIADWRAVLVMDAPTHRAMAAYNLGNALLSGEDPAFLNESISLLSHAVRHLERALPEAATAANRLAEAFQRRASEADGEPANKSELRRATRWSERAVRWARGSSSETLMRVAWDWGGRASKAKDWESAATAYSAAIDALQALVQANRLVGAKESWLGEGFGIATRAAQSLTLSGRADEAVVALEQARGLLLLDALDKGSEGDPARVTFAEIRSALVQQLLYLVPGPDTGVALLVDPKKPHAIAVLLNGLSESSVGGRVRSFHISATAAARNPKAWQLALDRISTWLGEVITPAVEAMAPGRVTVVPTGALAFLPVHAARTSAGAWSFADTSIIEYAPAALPLVAARRRPTPRGPNTLLAVVEPRPTIEPPLPFAAEEALVAAMTADSGRILAGEDATVEEVLRALPAHRTVHIACHGRADIANPRASGVILRDDARLSVNRLAGLDLSGVRLVFLSACETGVPGADAPDEVIALGSAFFAAGVDAVISSMWQVPDLATLILVALFYDELRNSQDPALSLAAAQRRMRANTNAELRTELRQMRDAGRLPETTYLLLETELDALPPANQAFKGPDSWAGFAFVGCGAASRSAHERC